MTPIGRFGEPREIAAAALFLASEDGSFMVGQIVSPNGGYVDLAFAAREIARDAFFLRLDSTTRAPISKPRIATTSIITSGWRNSFPALRHLLHRADDGAARRDAVTRALCLMGFDTMEISASGLSTPLGPALMADTEAHLKDVRTTLFDGEIIVPFENRKPGQKCFLMAAEFNLDMANLAAAEKRYREHHTSIARRLPGLRNYIIGKLGAKRRPLSDRDAGIRFGRGFQAGLRLAGRRGTHQGRRGHHSRRSRASARCAYRKSNAPLQSLLATSRIAGYCLRLLHVAEIWLAS